MMTKLSLHVIEDIDVIKGAIMLFYREPYCRVLYKISYSSSILQKLDQQSRKAIIRAVNRFVQGGR